MELLFAERDWLTFKRPRGSAGDDFFAIAPDGKQYSVEVKNTRSLNHSMFCQCKRNAGKHNRILAWHPSGWDYSGDYWILHIWVRGEPARTVAWRSNTQEIEVEEHEKD